MGFGGELFGHWDTLWRIWLRHCAISRKVAGSSPDYVIGFSIVVIIKAALWTWDRFLDGADKLIIFIYRLSRILEASPPPWKPRGLSRLVQGQLYLFLQLLNTELSLNESVVETRKNIKICSIIFKRPPLWSSGQSFWLQIQRSRVRFPALPDFLSGSGSGTGYTQPREPREVN